MSDANLDTGGNGTPNDDGAATPPAWTAQLEGDLKSHERLTQFQNISEMGKALIGTEEKLQNALFIPGEDATDEDRAAFYAKLGRPESFDKYAFGKPEGLPEHIPYNETTEAAFKQLAFDSGLSEKQAANLHEWYYNNVKQGAEQQKQASEAAINELKSEWKNSYDKNVEMAVRAFKQFGGEEAEIFIEKANVDGVYLADHPVFIKLFHAVASQISDDTMGGDRGGTGDAVMSDEEMAKKRFPNTQF